MELSRVPGNRDGLAVGRRFGQLCCAPSSLRIADLPAAFRHLACARGTERIVAVSRSIGPGGPASRADCRCRVDGGRPMTDPLEDRKILIIDDDAEILELLDLLLSRFGAQVATSRTAVEGLRQFYAFRPDLVLLDLMMPQMSGWEVCERLRALSDIPIIMLTALADTRDVARGLECGADDYVTKPFANQVLLARVRALLRRSTLTYSPAMGSAYDDGHLAIDLGRRQVLVRQSPVHLTPTEYKVLAYLFQHHDRVLTYAQILQNVWGPECGESAHYVHVYLHRLRNKLEADPEHPRYLLTEPGIGYRFSHRLGQST